MSNTDKIRAKVDALLMISCPSCAAPVSDDWMNKNECAALMCDRHQPSTAFCGICGKNCCDGAGAPDGVNDAHWHVQRCHYNKNPQEGPIKNMYIDHDTLAKGRLLLYRDRITSFMAEENLTKEVLYAAAKDLLDAVNMKM